MNADARFTDAALRSWKQNADRVEQFFASVSDAELEKEIAPGRNRLVYLLGHLAAVSDTMMSLLGLGERAHPELDTPFLKSPDRAAQSPHSIPNLREVAREIDARLWTALNGLTPAQWLERHTSVSAEDFAKEPHRNRFSVLLSRTAHMQFHYGQMVLTKARGE
jgi:uncharacterized damage-inducible protein DinB